MWSTRNQKCYSQDDVDYYRRQAEDAQAQLERQRQEEQEAGQRRRTGVRLAAERGERGSGWQGVATTLQDEESDPESWLDW